jgi:hypothetical protein
LVPLRRGRNLSPHRSSCGDDVFKTYVTSGRCRVFGSNWTLSIDAIWAAGRWEDSLEGWLRDSAGTPGGVGMTNMMEEFNKGQAWR